MTISLSVSRAVGFQPIVRDNLHHVAVYGCRLPGHLSEGTKGKEGGDVWHCPLSPLMLEQEAKEGEMPLAPPCETLADGTYFYAWVHNAPQHFELPDAIGYEIGGHSGIDYLVLQTHYDRQQLQGPPDDSGIQVTFAPAAANPGMRRASVFVSATEGMIPAKGVRHVEGSCPLTEEIEIHPVAYRVHAHSLGVSITGWQVTPDSKTWRAIGRRSPKQPQQYNLIMDRQLTLRQGDVIATRCVYNNTGDTDVRIG